MRFKLEFSTDNAAFQFTHGDGVSPFAVADTLREIANDIETRGDLHGSIRDVNGNCVGEYGHAD